MIAELMLIAITAVPVRFSPASPTIGDVVTVEVRHPNVAFAESEGIELVEAAGSRARLRMMRPGLQTVRFDVTAAARTVRLAFNVTVASVLAPDDALKPAPLAPPEPVPYPRAAWAAIAFAAGAAIVSWAALVMLHRRRRAHAAPITAQPVLSPREEFEVELHALAGRTDRAAAIGLANATRQYLAAVDASLPLELTTSELLARLGGRLAAVPKILRAGDRAKFAPWPASADPHLVEEARQLPLEYEVEEVAS